jgi:CheY-like chemotaxis protein
LGGEIFIESEPGKGSNFSFLIPCLQTQRVQHNTVVIEEPIKSQFSKGTILVVEDDFSNGEYLKEILNNRGLHILYAQNGKEAIHMPLNHNVDLVLMDINLPDIPGYEAIRQIRQYKPDLKIIVQTAYAAREDNQKAFNEGCNDYISKPLNKKLLLNMIQKHLSVSDRS